MKGKNVVKIGGSVLFRNRAARNLRALSAQMNCGNEKVLH